MESIKKRVSEEIEKAAQNNKENVVIEVPERYMDMIGEWIDEHGYGVNTYGKEHLFIYWDKEYLDLLETE